jgi:hypothetical protein
MRLTFPQFSACCETGFAVFCLSACVAMPGYAQNVQPREGTAIVASMNLPDAPQPRLSPEQEELQGPQSTAQDGSSSSTQTPATPPAPDAQGKPITTQKSQEAIADEQLKQQQKQRIMGVVPNFNTSYVYGAASLTTKQKFKLALRSATDPVQFLGVTPFVALIGQANADHYGYGGGISGYAKRYGQTFADNFDGTMLGNAVLPSLLHQDPRYFRLGRGSKKRRILYALGTNVITRHDKTGRWEPNYSNVFGNLAAGGISNLYLPKDERGFGSTISGGLTVTAEGGIGSMFQEFWPDLSRHFFHKDPTNGQDAINASQPDPTAGERLFSNKRLKRKADSQDAPK